jgi:tRNA pseudouridine38-40 synthase
VVVKELEVAPPGFHARHSAISRSYTYDVWLGRTRSALRRRRSYHVTGDLDVDSMSTAATLLVGSHDFRAFGRPTSPGGPTIRRLDAFEVLPRQSGVQFRVTGNAFLRHQVRRMVGLLLDVGRDSATQESVRAALAGAKDAPIARRVPASGLTLVSIGYPPDDELRENPVSPVSSEGV